MSHGLSVRRRTVAVLIGAGALAGVLVSGAGGSGLTAPTTGDAYGPCTVTSTTASGYARTPGGALIAAAQLVTRSEVYEPVATDTVRRHYVPGPLRDRLLAHIATHADEPMSPDGTGQLVAYSIPLFTVDNVTVTLAYAADGYPGFYVRVTAVLQWLDGDWRVLAPEDPDNVGQLATSIVGMTPFSRT